LNRFKIFVKINLTRVNPKVYHLRQLVQYSKNMKTVAISKRLKGINELLRKARQENIVIRSHDGTEFILAEIDDFNREIELTRQNKRLMKFLDQRAKLTKTIPLDEVKAQLGIK